MKIFFKKDGAGNLIELDPEKDIICLAFSNDRQRTELALALAEMAPRNAVRMYIIHPIEMSHQDAMHCIDEVEKRML